MGAAGQRVQAPLTAPALPASAGPAETDREAVSASSRKVPALGPGPGLLQTLPRCGKITRDKL